MFIFPLQKKQIDDVYTQITDILHWLKHLQICGLRLRGCVSVQLKSVWKALGLGLAASV